MTSVLAAILAIAGGLSAVATYSGHAQHLCDLGSDRVEQHNVAAAHPEVIGKIEKYLATARTESTQWPIK